MPGPKIRLGKLPTGGIEIKAGQTLRFKHGENLSSEMLPIQHDFSKQVKKGERLFLRDGQIQTEIISINSGVISSKALNSGKIMSDHGINLPDTIFKDGVLSEKDKKDLTVTNKLKSLGDLDIIGGPYFIAQLTSRVGSAANIEYHCRILQEKFIKRELIRISSEVTNKAFEDSSGLKWNLPVIIVCEKEPIYKRENILDGV